MKKEQLLELGLTEEQADKVLNLHKEVLAGFIPKARFDEVNETKKELEQQIRSETTSLKNSRKKSKAMRNWRKESKSSRKPTRPQRSSTRPKSKT